MSVEIWLRISPSLRTADASVKCSVAVALSLASLIEFC